MSALHRYRLTVEYDGRPFIGWQKQTCGVSVQEVLEAAAADISEPPHDIVAAGRTDAGVHALGQCAHLDLNKVWQEGRLLRALNARIGHATPVAVIAVQRARPKFHARFDAVRRVYLYRLTDRAAKPALEMGRVWRPRIGAPLDTEAMKTAARALVGHHDFTTFRESACQATSPMRTLDEVRILRRGNEIEITFASKSFLHRQVRSMTGSLVEVGRGHWPETRIAEILRAADRRRCGPVAPPDGLYLASVSYPDDAPEEE